MDTQSFHAFFVNGTVVIVNKITLKKEWPKRNTLVPGIKNVERKSLVDPKKILLPPLHIKLGLMKQLVRALPKEGECFQYLCAQFPGLSDAKLKEGVFVGPDLSVEKVKIIPTFDGNARLLPLFIKKM